MSRRTMRAARFNGPGTPVRIEEVPYPEPGPDQVVVRVPDGVSMSAAAVATDCVATPYHALRCRDGMRGGERVAVIGVGGLGGQTLRLASVLGTSQVVAVDVSRAALERARRFGATDTVLAVRGEDPSPQIHQLTGAGVGSSITHRLPLDQVPEALEILRTKRGDPERIVIEMEG